MLKQIKDEIVDKSYAGELDGGSPSVETVLLMIFAVGVGGFSWYDTGRVAETARTLFGQPIARADDEA